MDEIDRYVGNGWVTFAACQESGYSYPDKDLQHGIFTYYFTETIKEFDEGKYIIPEIFKVELFEKVRIHCESKNIDQTPTYNASISGNVFIAQRKITVKEDIDEAKSEAENLDEFELLKSRLNKIKGNTTSTSSEGKIKLKQIAMLCEKLIKEKEQNIHSYDCSIDVEDLNTADNIEDDIKKCIVKFINTKKYKPSHDIRLNTIYEKIRNTTPGSYLNSISMLSEAFGYEEEPKIKKIEYILEQDWDMPASYINLSICGNEYMPEGELFIYICPLNIKANILGGIKVDNEIKVMDELHLSLDDNIDEKIQPFIDEIIKMFNSKYYNSLLKQIDYLEWEKNL